MSSLADLKSDKFIKIMYIGDSGVGKTGSLTSLVQAGYKLYILDMDNGCKVLKEYVTKNCIDKLGNVDVETRRDKFKSTPGGPQVVGIPKAYIDATKLMTQWTDDTYPSEWGEETIFVIDSFTLLGQAAYQWTRGMNPGAKDGRQWYFSAQQSLENILSQLTSASFEANVIIISHINYTPLSDNAPEKGFPSAIGKALGPHIGKYFPTFLLAESIGFGANTKRRIRTVSTNLVTLKTPAPFKIAETYPLESGLATIFEQLKKD